MSQGFVTFNSTLLSLIMPSCTTGSLSWPLLKDTSDSSAAVSAKYTQVNSRSNKHRGDTASASCPLLLNFPRTNLCCLPLGGSRWQSAFALSRSRFTSNLFSFSTSPSASQGHLNEMRAPSCFPSPRKTDNEQAKCFWQQIGSLADQ